MPAQDKGEYEGVPRELLLKKIESLQQENSRLKEADKKFHLLFNRINDVVFVYHLTPKGPEPFLEINDRACTRYGYSREELLTMTFKDLGIKENFVNLPDLIQKLKRKKYMVFDSIHKTRDGKIIPVEISSHLFQYNGKETILSVARDISERQKAEAEINAQNTFLKNVIDSLKHPFFVIDADDHTIKMSNFSAKLTQNKTCFEFLHHYDQPCHHYGEACPLKEIKKTKKPVIMEHLHFEKNDIQKWVELHGYPIFDENGNITQIIEYCLDITERKKTVNLLKESEKRFRNLVEMLPYGIEEADTTGTITISNRAHHKILGYEDGELHGKKVWDFSVSPEEKIKNKNNFITQVKDQPERSSILRKNVRKDGKIIDIRVDWDYKRDSNGELTGFVSVISDVTGRKKAIDEAIFLAEILRQSTDSIVLTDMNGDITYVNPMFEKLTGYTSAETVGQNPRILKSESAPYPPEYYKVMWETLKKGDIWKGDFTNKKKNGEIFIEEASIFPFRDPESGEITGYGAVKKDITLRRKLEVQLKKSYNQVLYLKDKAEDANRLKSQFLANMSHDIRTPLNAVMGFTDLLSKDERRKKSRDYLNKIKTSSEGLLNLINDILDFSKIEAGQLDIYNRTFRLQVLNAGISNMFDIQFREKGVDFEINVSPAVPDNVFNDRWRLNQVLTNLLANSLKFTEKGRVELTIDYSGKDDVLTFKVIDTGIGINSEYMDRIFTPFTQIDDEETSNIANKGAGLGLAICDKLVQLMGGTITASSTYGKGTEFTLEIPANLTEAQETISAEALEKSEETNIDEKNGNRILIVDDNPVNRELILEQFINAGFNDLIVAENGKEAIEQALEHSPDLVLMDIQMPVMDGNEAITHLKSNGFKKPIITLSAYAMRSEIENSLSKGAVGYITKPIDFDTFFSRISAFLEKKIAPVSIPRQEHERRVMAKEPLHIIKDSVSERMRNIFLGDVENKLKDIERILKEDEFTPESVKRLKVIAHGYLGNAEYFGLSELSSISGELEQTIKDEEQNEKILALTKTLDVILKEIYTHNK